MNKESLQTLTLNSEVSEIQDFMKDTNSINHELYSNGKQFYNWNDFLLASHKNEASETLDKINTVIWYIVKNRTKIVGTRVNESTNKNEDITLERLFNGTGFFKRQVKKYFFNDEVTSAMSQCNIYSAFVKHLPIIDQLYDKNVIPHYSALESSLSTIKALTVSVIQDEDNTTETGISAMLDTMDIYDNGSYPETEVTGPYTALH